MASEKSEIPFRAIDAAVEKLLASSPDGTLTTAAVGKAINAGRSRAQAARIEQLLEGDGRFFSDGKGHFQLRSAFFRNYEFLITPDAWEIENGILLPGHRFAPYVSENVFPSDVKFSDETGEPVRRSEITAPLSQVFHYHFLLGSEQVFDFFLADSPANARIRNSAQPTDPVTLNVFQLDEFYRKNHFSSGDALLCRVLDYDTGAVAFRMLPGERRQQSDLNRWIESFESALDTVIDRFETYPEIPEQLSWACYCGAGTLPEVEKSASCDEFIRRAGRIEISYDPGHSVLARRDEGNEGGDTPELPAGVRVSRGETGEIAALLREIGSPLSPVEVDSFIIDNCYARELEFEDFFARAFGREKLNFADEAQQAVFYNYIEERFEELTGNYNRYDDEPKAPLRSTIMELVEDRLGFFDFLNSVEEQLDDLPGEDVHRLAEISLQLAEILKMLNNPGFTPDAGELDRLTETVEARADDQDALIGRLTDRFADREAGRLPKKDGDDLDGCGDQSHCHCH